MLTAHVNHELGIGFMTQSIWNGDYNHSTEGDFVFYRDKGTRDETGKPERELIPATAAVSELVTYYSGKAEEYDNLLHELLSILDAGDDVLSTRDLRRRVAPWLEGAGSPLA